MAKCVLEGLKRENECLALSDKAYKDHKKEGKCGTPKCRFFKTKEEQIKIENKCRKRCDEKGVIYKGLLTK